MMTRYTDRGMTLVELLIVMVILSVLLAIAVPNFANIITRNQITSSTSDFVSSLRVAKAESSAKMQTVVVCIRNGSTCNATNGTSAWNNGWLVFMDENDNAQFDNDEVILDQYDAFTRQITFTGTATDEDDNEIAIRSIQFTPAGRATLTSSVGANFTGETAFAMCSEDQVIRRGIFVTAAGHSSATYRIEEGDC